jgi:hypothetical protein
MRYVTVNTYSPTTHPLDTIHVSDTKCQQSSQSTCNGSRDEEVTDTHCEFGFGVEEGQIQVHAWEQSGFQRA